MDEEAPKAQNQKEEVQMKIVNMPIQVPSGGLCWDCNETFEICGYLDMEGGHPHCSLGFEPKCHHMPAGDDVEKDPKCLLLKEAEPTKGAS